uniref:Uncharacterized protein n=1 Tax=Lactuca sativa TaxID=4236 RepID=A0A9R1WB45_LACSA|nr:hypothetical protein LSAT_V11C300152880 [Lactuca sativa]
MDKVPYGLLQKTERLKSRHNLRTKALDINERELFMDHADTMKSYGDLLCFIITINIQSWLSSMFNFHISVPFIQLGFLTYYNIRYVVIHM